jgi:ketosteroid isomerase-like protein
MKQFLTFALLTGLIMSCNTKPDPAIAQAEAAAKAKAEANVALAERFIAAFESGDVETWREICSEDFVTWGPGIEAESTLDEYIESMKGFHEAVDSVKFETITILPHTFLEGEIAGDYVFWWGTNSAYFIEAGKSVKVMLHTVYKIVDGKIVFTADYWDTGDLQSQLSDKAKKTEKEKGETA